jgi:hypothetical protein
MALLESSISPAFSPANHPPPPKEPNQKLFLQPFSTRRPLQHLVKPRKNSRRNCKSTNQNLLWETEGTLHLLSEMKDT